MTVSTDIEGDTIAHPMPGWVAVIPITDSWGKKKEEKVLNTFLGPLIVEGGDTQQVLAGIVVELYDHSSLPFTPNETKVFFWSDRGVTIGARTFILEASVICYA